MSSEKKLVPFSEVQALVDNLGRLTRQREAIARAKYLHVVECDDPDERLYDHQDVLITVGASVLQSVLFAIIDFQIREVAEELAAIGIGVE